LKTFAGNMAVSGRGKLLLFFQSLKIAMAAMAGGRGGMIPWAWRGQQLSIKGKQAKSSHFLSKKVKETFLLFFLLTLLVFF